MYMQRDLIVECNHTSPTPRPVRPRCVVAKSATCVTWLIHICSPRVWHDLFIRPRCVCVTWLIHMCLSRVWHDSFIRPRCVGVNSAMCMTWLMYGCDTTHSSVWHDAFMCVTWLIHMCDMTHIMFASREGTALQHTHKLQHTHTLQHTCQSVIYPRCCTVTDCNNRLQQQTATTDCNNRLQQQTAPHLQAGDYSQVLHRLILIAGLTNS